YAVAIGGSAKDEFNESTPLAEDGFLYVVDSWGVLYKIDGRSGDTGRIVWRMDPKQAKQVTNRGATFWSNYVISPANEPRASSPPTRRPARSSGKPMSSATSRRFR